MKKQSIVSGTTAALLAIAWGCSSTDHHLGVEQASDNFVAPYAGED
ncbi:MAG: hypothetical protein K0S65_6090, partial [Labilithrix sp.]|nr:hypothetical protein [Labilithrix sp.]